MGLFVEEKIEKSSKFVEVQVDIDHALGRVRMIARAIGIWPFFPDGYTFRDAIKKRIKVITIYALLGFLIIPGYLHIFVEERVFSRRIQKLGAMTLNSMAVIKYTFLLRRSEKIKYLIETVEQDWKSYDREDFRKIMRKNVDVGHSLTKICACTFLAGATFFRLIKTLMNPVIVTGSGVIIKPLPSPIPRWLLGVDLSATPNYQIVFSLQIVSSAAVHSTTIVTFCFAAVFVMHACGEMDIVVLMMAKLIDGDNKLCNNEGFEKRLQTVVELHLRILQFVTRIEDLLSEICLVEVVGGTFTLCLTGYYFIMDVQQNDAFGILTYFIMVTSLVALIFTYCYIGEVLTEKAAEIGLNSYFVDWHRLEGKRGLVFALIIKVSRSEVKITAGKIIPLSLYNFGGIMRSAVGYLNLLRTVAG